MQVHKFMPGGHYDVASAVDGDPHDTYMTLNDARKETPYDMANDGDPHDTYMTLNDARKNTPYDIADEEDPHDTYMSLSDVRKGTIYEVADSTEAHDTYMSARGARGEDESPYDLATLPGNMEDEGVTAYMDVCSCLPACLPASLSLPLSLPSSLPPPCYYILSPANPGLPSPCDTNPSPSQSRCR